MKTRRLIQAFLGITTVFLLLWITQILMANHIARRDFSQSPCWFVPEEQPSRMPKLVAGPSGMYIPNPFQQINRRFVGFGLNEPNLYAPHFAVAALDAEGRPALWGWSFLHMDFWSISEKAQSRGNGPLADFATEAAIRAACPLLAAPVNAKRLDQ